MVFALAAVIFDVVLLTAFILMAHFAEPIARI